MSVPVNTRTIFLMPGSQLRYEETNNSKYVRAILLIQSAAGLAIGILAISHTGPLSAIGTTTGAFIITVELPIGLTAILTKQILEKFETRKNFTYSNTPLPLSVANNCPELFSRLLRNSCRHYANDNAGMLDLNQLIRVFNLTGINPFYTSRTAGFCLKLEVKQVNESALTPLIMYLCAEFLQSQQSMIYFKASPENRCQICEQFDAHPLKEYNQWELKKLIDTEDQDALPREEKTSAIWLLLRLLMKGTAIVHACTPDPCSSFQEKWTLKVLNT